MAKKKFRPVVVGTVAVAISALIILVGSWMTTSSRERGEITKSTANVRSLITLINSRAGEKGWPSYSGGKAFILSLVANGLIDARNPDNVDVLFSPFSTAERPAPEEYAQITREALRSGMDLSRFTSYYGRRNGNPDFMLNADRLARSVPVICDPLPPGGVILGYSNGNVKYVEWAELDLPNHDGDPPEAFLGDAAECEDLRGIDPY